MAAVYPITLRELWKGNVDIDGGTFKVLPVDVSYVYDPTDDFLDDVGGGSRLDTAQTVASTTFTDGLLDGDGVTFAGVANGDTITGLIFYLHTGVESTSRLIAFMDANLDASPMSFTSDGSSITADWPDGIAQI